MNHFVYCTKILKLKAHLSFLSLNEKFRGENIGGDAIEIMRYSNEISRKRK